MTRNERTQALADLGARLIAGEPSRATPIPLEQDGVVFRQMFEYGVVNFEAEVGFFARVFGFGTIALTSDYALFTPDDGAFHISFKRAEPDAATSMTGLTLLLMTADLTAAEDHLRATDLAGDIEIREGSPVQQVIHLQTPAGLPVAIWEDPTPNG